MANVLSIQVGRIEPLGPDRVPSAYVKRPVAGPVRVETLGLDGDSQADPTYHGGPEKAVYGYAAAHYARWRADHPQHAERLVPGGAGENLTIAGMEEDDLCVGDVHEVGSALLQVCQPRQPCFKFALYFDDNRMPKAMVRNGRAGWYYRVVRTGVIAPSDGVILVDRPNPDFPFARLVSLVNLGGATLAELERLAEMPGLATDWQRKAQQGLRAAGEGRTPP